MVTEQSNIPEAIAHMGAEAVRAEVQAMAAANEDNSERTQTSNGGKEYVSKL